MEFWHSVFSGLFRGYKAYGNFALFIFSNIGCIYTFINLDTFSTHTLLNIGLLSLIGLTYSSQKAYDAWEEYYDEYLEDERERTK